MQLLVDSLSHPADLNAKEPAFGVSISHNTLPSSVKVFESFFEDETGVEGDVGTLFCSAESIANSSDDGRMLILFTSTSTGTDRMESKSVLSPVGVCKARLPSSTISLIWNVGRPAFVSVKSRSVSSR